MRRRFEELQRVDRQLGDLASELKIEPIDPRGDLGLEPAAAAHALGAQPDLPAGCLQLGDRVRQLLGVDLDLCLDLCFDLRFGRRGNDPGRDDVERGPMGGLRGRIDRVQAPRGAVQHEGTPAGNGAADGAVLKRRVAEEPA